MKKYDVKLDRMMRRYILYLALLDLYLTARKSLIWKRADWIEVRFAKIMTNSGLCYALTFIPSITYGDLALPPAYDYYGSYWNNRRKSISSLTLVSNYLPELWESRPEGKTENEYWFRKGDLEPRIKLLRKAIRTIEHKIDNYKPAT